VNNASCAELEADRSVEFPHSRPHHRTIEWRYGLDPWHHG